MNRSQKEVKLTMNTNSAKNYLMTCRVSFDHMVTYRPWKIYPLTD